MMICPKCKADLEGGLIYETFSEEHGNEQAALDTAAACGATKAEGRWGRQIAIYDREKDRTVAFMCPDCGHEWER
jgi:hypothetical protein